MVFVVLGLNVCYVHKQKISHERYGSVRKAVEQMASNSEDHTNFVFLPHLEDE